MLLHCLSQLCTSSKVNVAGESLLIFMDCWNICISGQNANHCEFRQRTQGKWAFAGDDTRPGALSRWRLYFNNRWMVCWQEVDLLHSDSRTKGPASTHPQTNWIGPSTLSNILVEGANMTLFQPWSEAFIAGLHQYAGLWSWVSHLGAIV